MDTRQFEKIRLAFEQAAGLSPAEREKFIEGQCEPELRDQLRQMLKLHDTHSGVLDRSPIQSVSFGANAEAPAQPVLTDRIGKYEILCELGAGGFGRVYRAQDPAVRRHVAIKVLNRMAEADRIRFRNEAAAAGLLHHKNIVTIYELGEHQGQPYIAMEYLEGQDLQKILRSKRELTLLEKVSIIAQVAEGLHCAHERGIVHRDVKPANIMVLDDGRVKIMDFGIARLTYDPASRLTSEGDLLGTVGYMSPEQLSGNREINAQCDIFALGVIVYELIGQKHPFAGNDMWVAIRRILQEDPPSLRPKLPVSAMVIDRIVQRALQKERELRYQSLKDLMLDLSPALIELKRERAAELVQRAQNENRSDPSNSALAYLREALDLDPTNISARQLLESIQTTQQRLAIRPKVESLLQAAADAMSERKFSQAVTLLESASRLDRTDQVLAERLARARTALDLNRRTANLLSDARNALDRGDLPTAFRAASAALRSDPEDPEANELLESVQAKLQANERQRRLQEGLAKSRGLLLLNDVVNALDVLESLNAEFPGNEDLIQLLNQARGQKEELERMQQLRETVENAQGLLRHEDLEPAIGLLKKFSEDRPDDHELRELLAYAEQEFAVAKRKGSIDRAIEAALQAKHEQRYDEAATLLEEALGSYPEDAALLKALDSVVVAQNAQERSRAMAEGIARCGEHAEQERFFEALGIADELLRKYPGESQLVSLSQDLRKRIAEREQQQGVRNAMDSAESMLKAGRLDSAGAVLQQACELYPQEAGLQELRKQAQERIHQRDEENALAVAARQSGEEDFGGAADTLRQALLLHPGDERLTDALEKVAKAQSEWLRTREVDETLQQGEELLKAQDLSGVLRLLEPVAARYPDEERLEKLRKEAASQCEAQTRSIGGDRAADEISACLSKNELERAQELLAANEAFRGESRIEALRRRIEALGEVEESIRRAKLLLAEHHAGDAAVEVRRVLQKNPGHVDAQQLLASIEAQLGEQKRAQRRTTQDTPVFAGSPPAVQDVQPRLEEPSRKKTEPISGEPVSGVQAAVRPTNGRKFIYGGLGVAAVLTAIAALSIRQKPIEVSPELLKFEGETGIKTAQKVVVTGSSGRVDPVVSESWVKVVREADNQAQAVFVVRVAPEGMSPGSKHDATLTFPSQKIVHVELIMPTPSPAGKPAMEVAPTSLAFNESAGSPQEQTIAVTGPTRVPDPQSTEPWIHFRRRDSGPGKSFFVIRPNPTGLTPGKTYEGALIFSADTKVSVSVTVPQPSSPKFLSEPPSLAFPNGRGSFDEQTIRVTSSPNFPDPTSSQNWLTFSRKNLAPDKATFRIKVATDKLEPGKQQQAELIFSPQDRVAVSAILPAKAPAPSPSQCDVKPASLSFTYTRGGPVPAQQTVSFSCEAPPEPSKIPPWVRVNRINSSAEFAISVTPEKFDFDASDTVELANQKRIRVDLKIVEPPDAITPPFGTLRWTGVLNPGEELWLRGKRVLKGGSGAVSGLLKVGLTLDRTQAPSGITVVAEPAQSNNFTLCLRNDSGAPVTFLSIKWSRK
jgi:serine/threonine-protein kinase